MSAFDKVIGYAKEKEELFQLCDMARDPEKYAALGVRLPRGIMLYGVPGVGKTLMASALVEEMGRKCYICRKDKANGEFIDSIRETFEIAKQNAPSVIFLDDLDKFASDSYLNSPEELVAVQSGIDDVRWSDVLVVATANDIGRLPYSLLRDGRFDRAIEICPPNRKEATEIVRHYLSDKNVAGDVTAESVARLLDGNSCATLETVLNEAGIYAGYEGKTAIGREHIIRAALRKVFRADEVDEPVSDAVKEEVAFHEAGHTVVSLAFDRESVGMVSVRPSGSDARGVTQLFKSDDYFGSYDRMHERVVILLAGRAAVELKFGRLDVGAASDIRRASVIVQRFITQYAACGFDLTEPDEDDLLTAETHTDRIISERSAMIARCYEEAKAVLRKNWTFTEKLAAALIERNTLVFDEIEELCKETVA